MLSLEEFKTHSLKKSEAIRGGYYDTCIDNCVNYSDYTTSLPSGETDTDQLKPTSNDDCPDNG